MGMYASYMMVDDTTLSEMKSLKNKDLMVKINEIMNSENDVCDIDKLWDGMHFLLTGVSAGDPIENNPLSDAIVGVDTFNDDENADFVSYINVNKLPIILSALEAVELKELANNFVPLEFHQANIYPDIWQDEEGEELLEELTDYFERLRKFYKNAIKLQMNVIVGIF